MDFSLSEDQRQMQDEMAKSLERISSLQRVRELAQAGASLELPRDIWAQLCELGIPGILIEQRHGGLGMSLLDAALVAEQLGRFVVPGPFVASAVMAPIAIALSGSAQQQNTYLPKMASGSLVAAVAISEFAAGARPGSGVTAQGGKLNGCSIFALDCAGADVFIVADDQCGLHLVQAQQAGVTITLLDTVDRTRSVCKIDFNQADAEPLANEPAKALQRMRDAGRVMLAADTLGAAGSMLNKAVAYAGQRKQFGRLIGSFQAVKHICVDMAAELEPGRSLMWYAAYALDENREDASLASAHAKAYLADAGRMVARKATEVHGGIGITDALGLHYWFKRVGWNYQTLGSPERLRDEAARLQGLVA